ncbi:MAG TPA: hypothetical protein VGB42_10565 [Candidatus Thermoplasmatota archaeon]
MTVLVGVHGSDRARTRRASVTAPSPIRGTGTIDTGAGTTGVDERVMVALGVAPDGVTRRGTANGTKELNRYAVTVFVPDISLTISLRAAVGVRIAEQGVIVLIGRDVLSRMLFVYNGRQGRIDLAF